MGGGQSINQSTYQSALTDVNQFISEKCMNICYNEGTTFNINVVGGATVDTIKAGDSCMIN